MNLTESNNDWPLPVAQPEEVGFSAERLARLRPAMQKYVDEQKVPCMITLVARHGKIAYFDAVGYMDIESKQPVRKDAFFRLWSNTKPITGVATMILVEDGLLNLDDPVSKYIPAFKNPRVRNLNPDSTEETARSNLMMPTIPARREITVRDCLRNTTGLPTVNRIPLQEISLNRDVLVKARLLSGPVEARASSIKEMMENLAQLPLSAHPGTEFEYQVGYPAVGVVIETATGKTLDEFYRERIFGPLKMKDSSFYLPEGQIERFTTSYRMQQEGKNWGLVVVDRPETSEKVKGPKNWFGAGGDRGGVVTTIADYARLAQMLLNGGELDGVRILGRKTVELMTSNHTGNIPLPMRGPGWGFGMGVGVRIDTNTTPLLQSVGSYGWGGAAGTGYFADPEEDLFVIYFTQVMNRQMIPGGSYSEDIERLVYQALI
jgi:CubicO group peptidase (beta-lactamase class C family)